MKKLLAILVSLALIFSPSFTFASDTLMQSYTGSVNDTETVQSTPFWGEVFTTTSSYTLTSVKLQLFTAIAVNVTSTMSIYATSGGVPTGSALTTDAVPTVSDMGPTGTVYEITLGTPLLLSASTKYAIVLVDSLSHLKWRENDTAGDSNQYGVNSGPSWVSGSPAIFYFAAYGLSASGATVTSSGGLDLTGDW